jgi:monoamine oxidase
MAGSAIRQHWPTAPHALGSYACWRVGQARFGGLEGEAEGRYHFCGEHTSVDAQGYMEGAAETGLRAAQEVLSALDIVPGQRLQRLAAVAARRPMRSRRRAAGRRAKG